LLQVNIDPVPPTVQELSEFRFPFPLGKGLGVRFFESLIMLATENGKK
jgi:hypothetical protein